jgi:uncharacterized membrane protein YbhN (UPF0104 family)
MSRKVLAAVSIAATLALVYVAVPALAGLDDAWQRLRSGDPAWLVAAAGFELLSYAGYVALVHAVLWRHRDVAGWRFSYDVTLAGVAATRLFATAGAGGIALTSWAFSRIGLGAGEAARRVATLLVALYGVYLAGIVAAGLGLRTGLLEGPAPASLTVVPAAFAGLAMAAVVAMAVLHRDGRAASEDAGRLRRVVSAPLILGDGLRGAAALARAREPGLAGALVWWAADLLALWAAFRAFGQSPPAGALLMGYLLGMLGNTLPLPGGAGGVDGGMIAAFAALGTPAGHAVVAVLAYRAVSFWLPTVPGGVAYVALRRRLHASRSGKARNGARGDADARVEARS